MTPHKKDSLKILPLDVNSIKRDLKSFKSEVNRRFNILDKRFDNQELMFQQWKSEIHDLIDTGFTTKAKILDEEVAVLNLRTIETRDKAEKLESNMLN